MQAIQKAIALAAAASVVVSLVACAVEIARGGRREREREREREQVEDTGTKDLDRTVLHGDAVAWLEDPETKFPPRYSVFTSIPFDGECQGPSGRRFDRWGE